MSGKKKVLVSSLSVATVLSSVAPMVSAATFESEFTDVNEKSFGYEAISFLTSRDVIHGYPDNTFRPNEAILRGHVAILFVNYFDLATPNDLVRFTDILADSKWAESAAAVHEAGIFTGNTDGSFGPDENLTREQAATVLVKAFDLEHKKMEVLPFDDEETIASVHKQNVETLYQTGVILGHEDATFRPRDLVTRAQFSSMLHKLILIQEKQQKEEQDNTDNNIPTDNTAPEQVIGVAATSEANQITVNWNASSASDFKSYEIYYTPGETVSKTTTQATKLTVTDKSQLTKTITGLTSNTEYAFAIYAIDDNGNYSTPANFTKQTTALVEVKDGVNPFANNNSYDTSYVITPIKGNDGTYGEYGASTIGNNAIVNGNLTIKGDLDGNVSLVNLTVNGTIFLDPGNDGSVELNHVTADDIRVLSGEKGTIHFNTVRTNEVRVTDDNGVRLATDGTSSIGNITLSANAPSVETEVQLEGNFNSTTINVTKETKVSAQQGFSAKKINVSLAKENSTIELNGDFTQIETLEVSTPTTLSTKNGAIINDISLNIDESTTSKIVSLKGNLSIGNVTIDSPTNLEVDNLSTITKLNINNTVNIEGEIDNINSLEVNNEKAKVTSTGSSFASLMNSKVNAAITELKAFPTDNVTLENKTEFNSVRKLIDTAIAFGADTGVDFIKEEVDYYKIFTGIQSVLESKVTAVEKVEDTLGELPSDPSSVKFAGLSVLKEKVTAVNDAISVAKDIGVSENYIISAAGYSLLDLADSRIKEIESNKVSFIQDANQAIADVPIVEDITVDTLAVGESKVVVAKEKIAIARSKGAVDADFNNLEKVANVLNKINTIKREKADAISDIEQLISSLPVKLEYSNMVLVQQGLNEIQTKIEESAEKGVSIEDIKNYADYITTQTTIEKLLEEKNESIVIVEELVASLPAITEVTKDNLNSVRNTLEEIGLSLETAREKGATDKEIDNLAIYQEIDSKVVETLAGILTATNKALAEIPIVALVTANNLSDVEAKIFAAEELLGYAREHGISDDEILGLAKLSEVKIKIEELKQTKTERIELANQSIKSLPASNMVTVDNWETVQAKWLRAKTAVEAALKAGASVADLIDADKLTAVKTAIDEVKQLPTYTDEYDSLDGLQDINESPNGFTVEQLRFATNQRIYEGEISKYQFAISNYKEDVNRDLDLSDVNIIVKSINKTISVDLLDTLKADPGNVSFSVLYTIQGSAREDLLVEYQTRLSKFANVSLSTVHDVITQVNQETALKYFNENSTFETMNQMTDALIGSWGGFNVYHELKGQYEQASLAYTENGFTSNELAQAIKNVNEQHFSQLVESINQDINSFDYDQLYYFSNYVSSSRITEKAYEALKASEGEITKEDIETALTKALGDSVVNLVNTNAGLITHNDLYEVLGYQLVEFNNLNSYRDVLTVLATEDEEVTIEKIREAIVSANQNSSTTYLDYINNNPSSFTKYDIGKLDYYYFNEAYLEDYRTAILTAKDESIYLTKSLLEDLIVKVNKQKALNLVVTNPQQVTTDVLMDATNTLIIEELITEYINKIEEAINSDQILTANSLEDLISAVNEIYIQKVLVKLNESTLSLTFEELRLFGNPIESVEMHNYQHALDDWIEINGPFQQKRDIYEVIIKVNRQEVIKDINQGNVNYRLIQSFANYGTYGYYQNKYEEGVRELLNEPTALLTESILTQIINRINAEIELEIAKQISLNPETLTVELLNSVNIYCNQEQLSIFKQILTEKVQSNGGEVVSFSEIESIEKLVQQQSIVNKINKNISFVTSQNLYEVVGHVNDKDLFNKYIAAIKKNANYGSLTSQDIVNIVVAVNEQEFTETLKLVNSNSDAITIEMLERIGLYNLDEDNLGAYKIAIKAENADLNVDGLRQLVRNVDEAKTLLVINGDPVNITVEALQIFANVEDPNQLSRYQTAVSEAKIANKDEDLTPDQVRDAIFKINTLIRNELRSGALLKINNDTNSLSLAMMRYFYINGFVGYLDRYKTAVKTAQTENNGTLDEQQLIKTLELEHSDIALELINQDQITITKEIISGVTNDGLYYDTELYATALQKVIKSNGALTKEQISEIVILVNQEQAMEQLLTNYDSFELFELDILFGGENVESNLIEDYRIAVTKLVKENDVVTNEMLKTAIVTINQEKAVEIIEQDIEGFELYLLDKLVENFKWDLDADYRYAITEKAKDGTLTVAEVINAVTQVTETQLNTNLQYIIDNPESFSYDDLAVVLGYDVVQSAHLEDYRSEIVKLVSSTVDITLSLLLETVTTVNESVLTTFETSESEAISSFNSTLNQEGSIITDEERLDLITTQISGLFDEVGNLLAADEQVIAGLREELIDIGSTTSIDIAPMLKKLNIADELQISSEASSSNSAVNKLWVSEIDRTIREELTLDQINNVQSQIDALASTSLVKPLLEDELAEIQEIFTIRTTSEAVNKLFDETTNLLDVVTNETVSVAQTLVNELPVDYPDKKSLQMKLDEAWTQLLQKELKDLQLDVIVDSSVAEENSLSELLFTTSGGPVLSDTVTINYESVFDRNADVQEDADYLVLKDQVDGSKVLEIIGTNTTGSADEEYVLVEFSNEGASIQQEFSVSFLQEDTSSDGSITVGTK
ncbi:S-layer homology domain-containing protein [Virgibacillus sp. DJP39]|uniref:S-layer homology domain-containing protein n=1 Tax=Virgibacillus sp. DJP39 TaxID=3409790 RepID=UPI003BB703C4